MSIQCTKCKSMNPPSEEKCNTCGAGLLPGFGEPRRYTGIVFSILGMILFGYLGFSAQKSSHPSSLLILMTVIMLGFFAYSLFVAIKGPAKSVRYAFRAKRHIKIDLDQAYADFTEAVRLQPTLLVAHQGRNSLYDQLDLSIENLSEEIEFIANILKNSKSSNEQLREELTNQTIDLCNKRINREVEIGLTDESLKHLLQLLDFVEAHVDDLHRFKTPDFSFGTGVTLHLRGETRKNIEETRKELFLNGSVKAVGYCRRCKEEVEPDLNFDCTRNKSHGKVSKLKFFISEILPTSSST